ncbi:hypothetical protein N9D38_08420 [Rubripirellula sp.]|jgi:hypothetical protein|nr:hypothetical protein [Rubripirellula sp.]
MISRTHREVRFFHGLIQRLTKFSHPETVGQAIHDGLKLGDAYRTPKSHCHSSAAAHLLAAR